MSWSNAVPVLLALTMPVTAHLPHGSGSDDRPARSGPAALSSPAVGTDRLLHTSLDHTVPADGDTLTSVPDSLVLVFTGGLEEAGSALTLFGPDGAPRPLEPRVTVGGARQRVEAAPIPELGGGAYTVEWRVLSLDGHPVEGSFSFVVDAPPAPAPSTAPPGGAESGSDSTRAGPDGGTDRPGSPVAPGSPGADADVPERADTEWSLVIVTSLAHLSVMGLAGLLLFATWAAGSPSAVTLKTGLALAVAAALASPLQAWMWAGEALGEGAGVAERTSGLLTLTSGRAPALRAALAIPALGALALGRRTGIAAALALLAVASGALGGHVVSASTGWAQPVNGVHLLAVAAWLGGLLFLVTERKSAGYVATVRRVSSVALVCAGVVALTGAIQAWLLVGSPSSLLESRYGLLVLAKVAGLLSLVAFGATHRLKTIPSLLDRSEQGPIDRTVRVELAVACAVVLLATLLAHTPVP